MNVPDMRDKPGDAVSNVNPYKKFFLKPQLNNSVFLNNIKHFL